MTNDFFSAFADAIAERVAAKLAPAKPAKRLFAIPEAAEYIGRTPEAVKQMASRGELPTVRAGRRVHFDIKDLDNWIAENKV